MKMKNEHIKWMNKYPQWTGSQPFHVGDIDMDLITEESIERVAVNLHLEGEELHEFLLDCIRQNGLIRGKMIYGFGHPTVYRKLRDITEEEGE